MQTLAGIKTMHVFSNTKIVLSSFLSQRAGVLRFTEILGQDTWATDRWVLSKTLSGPEKVLVKTYMLDIDNIWFYTRATTNTEHSFFRMNLDLAAD